MLGIKPMECASNHCFNIGDDGLLLEDSSQTYIVNSTISNNYIAGIILSGLSQVIIQDSKILDNLRWGLWATEYDGGITGGDNEIRSNGSNIGGLPLSVLEELKS